jgi:inorganic pyrophosphatase
MLPSTDPTHIHPDAKTRGDNDPLDVVEIGSRIVNPGVSEDVFVHHEVVPT